MKIYAEDLESLTELTDGMYCVRCDRDRVTHLRIWRKGGIQTYICITHYKLQHTALRYWLRKGSRRRKRRVGRSEAVPMDVYCDRCAITHTVGTHLRTPISCTSVLIPSYQEHQKPSQFARLPTIPLYVPPHKRIQPISTSISETHSTKKDESCNWKKKDFRRMSYMKSYSCCGFTVEFWPILGAYRSVSLHCGPAARMPMKLRKALRKTNSCHSWGKRSRHFFIWSPTKQSVPHPNMSPVSGLACPRWGNYLQIKQTHIYDLEDIKYSHRRLGLRHCRFVGSANDISNRFSRVYAVQPSFAYVTRIRILKGGLHIQRRSAMKPPNLVF